MSSSHWSTTSGLHSSSASTAGPSSTAGYDHAAPTDLPTSTSFPAATSHQSALNYLANTGYAAGPTGSPYARGASSHSNSDYQLFYRPSSSPSAHSIAAYQRSNQPSYQLFYRPESECEPDTDTLKTVWIPKQYDRDKEGNRSWSIQDRINLLNMFGPGVKKITIREIPE